jgi:hypothetical protein
LPNYLLVHPLLDRVSNVHNRHPEWFDDPLVLSWDLSANRLLQKKEWRGAAALYSTPSGHKTTSKSNEPVGDIRRRVAMSRKGGYVGCATDASVGGKRIAFKLRQRLLRTHVESEPTGRVGREPCQHLGVGAAVVLGARAGLAADRAVARERCHPVRHESAAPSRYPSRARRRALRRPTATRMPKMMASGRGGQPGI